MAKRLERIAARCPAGAATPRGRGMMRGLSFTRPKQASETARAAFKKGLIIETSGAESQVVKCLPPLIIGDDELLAGTRYA